MSGCAHALSRSVAFIALSLGAAAAADVTLPSVISNNMVLQRSSEVAIWGWASPGEAVTISATWHDAGPLAKTTAESDGSWRTTIATPTAGGPFALTVTGDNTITLDNVLIGEVWVCSGQSNMEWPVARADNAEAEIAAADHPQIRLFSVANTFSLHEQLDAQGSWSVCSPDTISSFSAVGYYFGRELNTELGVPIGLIASDWGGTVAEAWTSERVVRQVPGFEKALDFIEQSRDPARRMNLTKANQENWWRRLDAVGDNKPPRGWNSTDFDDSAWETISLPASLTGDTLGNFDGLVYFRLKTRLPRGWNADKATLELGPIDDYDDVWINGKHVASTHAEGMWNVARKYAVPSNVLVPRNNVIAVRMLDTGGIAGINGKPNQIKLTQGDRTVSLAGEWRFKSGSTQASLPAMPSSPRVNQNTPTTLYNGMIAPIIPYTIRGAIWYQGESNRTRAKQYRTLFPAMIQNWRDDWGLGDFPFYFVQIAPFNYGNDKGQAAELREAQFMTLASPNTGMVVTTDIGNPANIHPTNKQEVGRRLSLWAIANDYGRDVASFSGPLYEGMTVNGSEVRLTFTHADGGLVARGGPLTHFTIAGADKVFVPASARIDGKTIVVSSEKVPDPVAVRFGWGAADEPNLFNAHGLPASTFRTDDW
jgi:sialate O-acetylesterase